MDLESNKLPQHVLHGFQQLLARKSVGAHILHAPHGTSALNVGGVSRENDGGYVY
jgi:hypothetical protein